MAQSGLAAPIRAFLVARIVVGEPMLPTLYADPDRLDLLQAGFRYHGITGESLVSDARGAWQPGWHVLALNALDDPFVIDMGEGPEGYPVYHAPHGAGVWEAELIAPSLARFGEILARLRPVRDDSAAFLRVLAAETQLVGSFWQEVSTARLEADKEPQAGAVAYEASDYLSGRLVVTGVGPNKLQVVRIIHQALGLSLKQGLALAGAGEFIAGSGNAIQLRRLRGELEAAGATVEFRLGE
ncbi:MAG TPA: hypothetical protein VGM83_18760 [Devosiaceae bacterium]|jgi:hypothetical protein